MSLVSHAFADAVEERALRHLIAEHDCLRAFRLLAEYEVVGGGLRVGTPLMSIVRLERREKHRRLLLLRESLRDATKALTKHVIDMAKALGAGSEALRALNVNDEYEHESAVEGNNEDSLEATTDTLTLLSLRRGLAVATSQRVLFVQALPTSPSVSLSYLAALPSSLSLSASIERLRHNMAVARAPSTEALAQPTNPRISQTRSLNASLLTVAWRFQSFLDDGVPATDRLREHIALIRSDLSEALRLCDVVELACNDEDVGKKRQRVAQDMSGAPREEARETAPEMSVGDGRVEEEEEAAEEFGREEQVFEGAPLGIEPRLARGPLLPREDRIRLRKEELQREDEERERLNSGVRLVSELRDVLRVQNRLKEE